MLHTRGVAALAWVLLTAWPALAAAQQPSPDFLFGPPRGMIGFRSGWMFASTNSDLFEFVQKQLTVDGGDFNAPAIGVDVEISATPRVSALAGFEFARGSTSSEYRDFVDNNRLPITQTSRLTETNFNAGIKFAVTPRGREISSRAWIPAAVTPYVGAGAGILKYEFLQYGDFIDVDTVNMEIFTDTLRTSGWAPSAHVFGGVDVKVWRRMYLSAEARYLWSNADPSGGSSRGTRPVFNFDSLDLAGLKTTVGVHYMF